MCPASQADLTAQAKIRDAAIAHFARDGFQKTGLRAVAEVALFLPLLRWWTRLFAPGATLSRSGNVVLHYRF
ncbi:hypothetical protein [Nonomuraea rubra]|uniref:hypothetical protein n=1 Tax=Nonomuraea rubra TaxID=46180 RepID=UPI0033D4DC24